MSNYQLIISPATQKDLKDIYLFGLRNWGRHRSSSYIDLLKEQLWTLTTQPFIGVERPELLPDMRSFPVESHVVFYRLQATQLEIVRILHGRQDPSRQIK